MLHDDREMIRGRPCHLIVLLPSVEAVAARGGLWLDTTELSPAETVEAILARTQRDG